MKHSVCAVDATERMGLRILAYWYYNLYKHVLLYVSEIANSFLSLHILLRSSMADQHLCNAIKHAVDF